jgi:xanthine/uracil permease
MTIVLMSLLRITAPTDFLWFTGGLSVLLFSTVTFLGLRKFVLPTSDKRKLFLVLASIVAGLIFTFLLFFLILWRSQGKQVCC